MSLSQALAGSWRWRSRQPDMTGHCFYVIYDGQTVLYVGRSIMPLRRLQQHLGREGQARKSQLGRAIMDAVSLRTWTVKFFTLDDCAALLAQHIPPERHQRLQANPASQFLLHALTEQALIDEHHPRLNVHTETYDSAAIPNERYTLKRAPLNS